MFKQFWKKMRNIIDFLFRRGYNINKNKEKEKKQMREKLMAMKIAAERDILYAQAKLEVIGNLLANDNEVVASAPVADQLTCCDSVVDESMDTI